MSVRRTIFPRLVSGRGEAMTAKCKCGHGEDEHAGIWGCVCKINSKYDWHYCECVEYRPVKKAKKK
jgi:hypothetical protein